MEQLRPRVKRTVGLIVKALKVSQTKAGHISDLGLAYNLLNFNEYYH
jgi:hypothetical protein